MMNSLPFRSAHVSLHNNYCDVYHRAIEIMETPSEERNGKYQSMHKKTT